MRTLIKLLSTVLFFGYTPILPGTTASAIGLLIYLYFLAGRSPLIHIASALIFIVIGFLVCGRAEQIFGKKDSRRIIIDDFCGSLVALFLIKPAPVPIVLAFFLFRFFDIFKPIPIKQLEKLPGSAGVMLDDIVAGLYANLTVQLISLFLK